MNLKNLLSMKSSHSSLTVADATTNDVMEAAMAAMTSIEVGPVSSTVVATITATGETTSADVDPTRSDEHN